MGTLRTMDESSHYLPLPTQTHVHLQGWQTPSKHSTFFLRNGIDDYGGTGR